MIAGRMRIATAQATRACCRTAGPVDDSRARRDPLRTAEQEDGRMEGFQLWLNLAAKDKSGRLGIAISRARRYRSSRPLAA